MKTKGYQGKIRKTAQVFSNDPKRAQTNVSLEGVVWAPVYVQPRHVQFTGTEGDELRKDIRLTSQKEDPLVLEVASVSIPDKVEVTLEEKEKGRTYLLKVKDKTGALGKYRGKITLKTNFPEKPEIVVPITANVRGSLEIRPNTVSFGRMPLERLGQIKERSGVITRSVTVLLNRGTGLKVEKIEVDNALFTTSTQDIQPGRAIRVIVQPVVEKLKKGANQDLLKIHTNQKGHEVIEVPVKLDLQ